MGNISEVVKNLIIINVIFFLGSTMLMGPDGTLIPLHRLNLALHFPLSNAFQPPGYDMPITNGFQPYQIITHMFMHGDLGHLFFNMLGLFFFGPPLERLWGAKRFLFFYLAAGLGAALIHTGASYYEYNKMIQPIIENSATMDVLAMSKEVANLIVPALGASGAVYAVFVGFAILFPREKVMLLIPPIPMRASVLVLLLIAYDLYAGLSGSGTGIAHFAHLGGAFFGALMVWYWKSKGRGYM